MFGQRQHPLKSSYLMQRFVPARPESATFVYRCSWKKDVGYKVHKITSLVTETTEGSNEEHVKAEKSLPTPKSDQTLRDFKLVNLGSLTDAYKTIQTYSAEKVKHHLSLHMSPPGAMFHRDPDSPQRGGVKLDLDSLKNQ